MFIYIFWNGGYEDVSGQCFHAGNDRKSQEDGILLTTIISSFHTRPI